MFKRFRQWFCARKGHPHQRNAVPIVGLHPWEPESEVMYCRGCGAAVAQLTEQRDALLEQLAQTNSLSLEWMQKHDRLLGFIQARPAILRELIADDAAPCRQRERERYVMTTGNETMDKANEIVWMVHNSFKRAALENGLHFDDLRPIADLVVERLEDAGYSPESIELIFGDGPKMTITTGKQESGEV